MEKDYLNEEFLNGMIGSLGMFNQAQTIIVKKLLKDIDKLSRVKTLTSIQDTLLQREVEITDRCDPKYLEAVHDAANVVTGLLIESLNGKE